MPVFVQMIIFILLCAIILLLILFAAKKSIISKYDAILDNVNNLPIPMMVIDYLHNTVVRCNSALKQVISIENVTNCSISKLGIFNDFNDYLKIKKTCTEKSTVTPNKIKFKINNKIEYLLVAYSLIRINEKDYMVLTFDDKTDILEYIKSLGVFTTIINRSKDGVIISKFDDTTNYISPKIVYVNDAVSDITGYTKEKLLNNSLLDALFSLNVKDDIFVELSNSIEKLNKCTLECEYIKNDNTIVWVLVEIIPIDKNNIIESLKNIDNGSLTESLKSKLNDADLYITIKQTDITNYKKRENTSLTLVNNLNKIANTKGKANEILTDGLMEIIDSDEESIHKALELIGKALCAKHGYIIQLIDNNKLGHDLRFIYKWTNNTYKDTKKINDSLMSKTMLNNLDGYEIYANLVSNKISKLYANSIKTPELKQLFDLGNIKSMIICPIYVDNELYGYVGFDECYNDNRIWDANDDNIIKSFADKLGNIL
jgi:PAS domain S-box-containing protein